MTSKKEISSATIKDNNLNISVTIEGCEDMVIEMLGVVVDAINKAKKEDGCAKEKKT